MTEYLGRSVHDIIREQKSKVSERRKVLDAPHNASSSASCSSAVSTPTMSASIPIRSSHTLNATSLASSLTDSDHEINFPSSMRKKSRDGYSGRDLVGGRLSHFTRGRHAFSALTTQAVQAAPLSTSPFSGFGGMHIPPRSPTVRSSSTCSAASLCSISSSSSSLTPRTRHERRKSAPGKRLFGIKQQGGGGVGLGTSLSTSGTADPYHFGVKTLYLHTMRMRDEVSHNDHILSRWRETHPDLRDPSFCNHVSRNFLNDDLLAEVVSWVPAVVVVQSACKTPEELSLDTKEWGHRKVPHRYSTGRMHTTASLHEALTLGRDGDLVAVCGTIFIPSTLTLEGRCSMYGVSDGDGNPAALSAGCASSYPMLKLKPGATLSLTNLTLSCDTAVSIDKASLKMHKCEVNGGIVQEGGTLNVTKSNIKTFTKSMGPYGVYCHSGAVARISQSSICGHGIGCKVSESNCELRDVRITNAVSGGLMAKSGAVVLLERVDFQFSKDPPSALAPEVQISTGVTSFVMLDSKVGPSQQCCIKVVTEAPVPTERGVVKLIRNHLHASAEASTCVTIPAAKCLSLTLEQNEFVSPATAVSSKLTSTSHLLLDGNIFQQNEQTAVVHVGDPHCIEKVNNRFSNRS